MQRQDYSGPGDLRAMQELVQRSYAVESRFHIGDLAWEYSSAAPTRQAGQSIGFQPGLRTVNYRLASSAVEPEVVRAGLSIGG